MKNIFFSIPVSILKEGENFIAYSPVLDLSTYSDSLDGAQKMFEEALEAFFEELNSRGIIEYAK